MFAGAGTNEGRSELPLGAAAEADDVVVAAGADVPALVPVTVTVDVVAESDELPHADAMRPVASSAAART